MDDIVVFRAVLAVVAVVGFLVGLVYLMAAADVHHDRQELVDRMREGGM